MSELTGNVMDAAVCYQKAIQQDSNKLANRMVCSIVLCDDNKSAYATITIPQNK